MKWSGTKGLRFRACTGPEDFAPMVACANASATADRTDIFLTIDDVERDHASFDGGVPEHDVWIADAGGEIAGYVRSWHWAQADGLRVYGQFGVVSPQWRRRGVGTSLQAWLERRQREVACAHADAPASAHAHQAFVNQGEGARVAMLEKAGYKPVRYVYAMMRPTLEAIVDFPLPQGLELRAARPEHFRAIWDAHVRAFRTHWGFSAPGVADYEAWLASKVFQPHLWQVAWDVRTGEVAGQVRAYIDETYNVAHNRKMGWTEFISVGEPWRRRGLARALVSRSLHVQRNAGMKESSLGVDGSNLDGANRVYEDCGFVVAKRHCIYRKPLVLDADG